MLTPKYVEELNKAINEAILNNSLFKERKQTGKTAELVRNSKSRDQGDVIIKELPGYIPDIGLGKPKNNIIETSVEIALKETAPLLISDLINQITNKLIK